jgi:hypothetical protein
MDEEFEKLSKKRRRISLLVFLLMIAAILILRAVRAGIVN